MRSQLDQGITHIGPHFHTRSEARFYEELLGILPKHLRRLHPTTNGTEATEAALQACMHFTGRRSFLGFKGGYHGRTLGSLAVSAARGANAGLVEFRPTTWFAPYPANVAELAEAMSEARRIIAELASSSDALAGIIVEPIQATGGVIIPPDDFLRVIETEAHAHRIPLIVGEIYTGFGRTGRYFAFEHAGIQPDVLLMGKSMGGGFPGGLVAASEEILSAWPGGAQSSTFQLHPVTAAAGNAALRDLLDEDLCARAKSIGGWMENYRNNLEACSLVFEFLGTGAMYGIELRPVEPHSSSRLCRRVRLAALKQGLITWEYGIAGEVIGLMPPLIASRDDVDRACAMLLESLLAFQRAIAGS